MSHDTPMVDVSSEPEHSPTIGRKYMLNEDLLALGISSNKYKHPQAEHVVLVKRPGFGGRFVVSRSYLKKGTVVQVVSVLTPKYFFDSFLGNIFSGFKETYLVKEVGSNQLVGQIIQINNYGESDNSIYGLDAYKIVR